MFLIDDGRLLNDAWNIDRTGLEAGTMGMCQKIHLFA